MFVIIINYCEKKQYPENIVFHEKILSLHKTAKTEPMKVTIDSVFNFDFDKAYVVNVKYVYADEEYFTETLGFKTNIDIPTLESGIHNRILFFKDDVIIYDFIYEIYKLKIKETEIWIYPNTTIAFTQHNFIDEKNDFIQLEFINTNS